MKSLKFNSEEEFAEVIVNWLKKNEWTVYQEVQCFNSGSIADIVAEKNGKYWIIECKLNFGFKVMHQADEWRDFANYVSIAIPYSKFTSFRRKICRLLNIGILRVSENWYNEYKIDEYLEATEQELRHKHLINALTERHKTFAKAGNNSGNRLTPFKFTVERLIAYVEKNNGCLLKEAIKNIKHHYAHHRSASSCLANLINTNVIKELYLERKKEGNRVYLKNL